MNVVRITAQFAKNAIFPAFCFGCGKEETYLCAECFDSLDLFGVWACPMCHKPQVGGLCCSGCQNKSSIVRHIAMINFDEQKMFGQIIHAWKYGFVEELRLLFEMCAKKFIVSAPEAFYGIDAVVPVPLHPRRFAERGFNQAEVLANIVGMFLHVPVYIFLERVRYTSQQALLSKEDRKLNVKDAFRVLPVVSPHIRSILLVDDVYTTGSTMQECAKVFLQKNIKVSSFSLARG